MYSKIYRCPFTWADTYENTPARAGSFVQEKAESTCVLAAGVGVCGVSCLSTSEERMPGGRMCKDPVDHFHSWKGGSWIYWSRVENRDRVGGERGKGKGMERKKYILIVLCKIVIKSKSHFPSSHVCEKLSQRSKSNFCCCDCSGKQTDYFSVCDGFKVTNIAAVHWVSIFAITLQSDKDTHFCYMR